MKIKVSCSCGSENCLECAIVELQGTAELNLHFKPTFKTSELANSAEFHPLPTQKVKGLMDVDLAYYDSNNKGDLPSSKVELYVIGIIRHKIFFKPRPKALISKPQPLVKEGARAAGHHVLNQLGFKRSCPLEDPAKVDTRHHFG